jgi:hypothetical protein
LIRAAVSGFGPRAVLDDSGLTEEGGDSLYRESLFRMPVPGKSLAGSTEFLSTSAIVTEEPSMKLRSLVAAFGLSLLVSVAPAFAALPTVNTFTVAATAVSPVPVTAFTASDSDGTVVAYMITQTSSKPGASDSRWTSSAWTQYTTTSIGALTLYAWAKDNAGGVSNSRSTTTNVVGGHVHPMSAVTGLTTALAGKADAGHDHDPVYQKKYANVVVVAKAGGDTTDLAAAIGSITDASADNPYLIKVMPGVFQIGGGVIPPYVDVEGSGQGATIIRTSGASQLSGGEIRDITIEHLGLSEVGGVQALVVSGVSGSTAKVSNVTVKVTRNPAIPDEWPSWVWGIDLSAGSATLTNVSIMIDAQGGHAYGIYKSGWAGPVRFENVDVRIVNASETWGIYAIVSPSSNYEPVILHGARVNVSAAGMAAGLFFLGSNESQYGTDTFQVKGCDIQSTDAGITAYSGYTEIVNSRVSGTNYAVAVGPAPGTTKVSFSELDGLLPGSTIACYSVHDASFIGRTCP